MRLVRGTCVSYNKMLVVVVMVAVDDAGGAFFKWFCAPLYGVDHNEPVSH